MADDINNQVHYFDHQFLRARDFETEQEYLNDRRWRHTRGFHSAGIVDGLVVSRVGATTTYHVGDGWAVDDDGHEAIVLPGGMDVTASPSQWIWIVSRRQQSTPSSDPGLTAFNTRWDETPSIVATAAGAGPAKAVLLAKLDGAGAVNLADRQEVQIRADDTIRSKDIREADGTTGQNTAIGSGVKTAHIQDGAITSAKIAASAVRSEDIAVADGTTGQNAATGDGVKTPHVQNSAITEPKLAAASVSTTKIVDGAVTNNKIADGTITPAKLDQTQNFPATSVQGEVTLWNQNPAVTLPLRVPLRWIANNTGAWIGSLQVQKTGGGVGGALSVAGPAAVDATDSNTGTIANGLTFGNASGEGIGSRRNIGANRFGLDIYTNSAPRLSITNAGNVGIGTVTPVARLQVVGGAIMPAVGNAETAGIFFPPDPGGGAGDRAYIRYFVEAGETTKLLIGTENDADDRISFSQFGAERMTIASGNVGVGTQNPQRRLHVHDSEIHSGGPSGGFSFGNRVANEFIEAQPGDRWVWYSQNRVAWLWTSGAGAGNRIAVETNGNLTVDAGQANTGTSAPGIAFGGVGSGEAIASKRDAGGNRWGLDFYTSFANRMSIRNNGNVGIGTTTPTFLLDVNGSFRCTSITVTNFATKAGYVVDQFVNARGDSFEQGDVVVLGDVEPSLKWAVEEVPIPEVDLATDAYDTRVCGIVAQTRSRIEESSGEPSVVVLTPEELAEIDPNKVEPGQIGTFVTLGAFANCKVDADIAPIAIGDLLTTSPTPGHAQKADPKKAVGAILGKAMGGLDKGKGRIPVLVLLH